MRLRKPRWQILVNHGMILHALERSEKRSPRAVKINQHAAAIIPLNSREAGDNLNARS